MLISRFGASSVGAGAVCGPICCWAGLHVIYPIDRARIDREDRTRLNFAVSVK